MNISARLQLHDDPTNKMQVGKMTFLFKVRSSETEGASCHTQGLICSYSGATCPGAAHPLTDTCICEPGAADGGFLIRCEPASCPVPLLDSGTPDADAG